MAFFPASTPPGIGMGARPPTSTQREKSWEDVLLRCGKNSRICLSRYVGV